MGEFSNNDAGDKIAAFFHAPLALLKVAAQLSLLLGVALSTMIAIWLIFSGFVLFFWYALVAVGVVSTAPYTGAVLVFGAILGVVSWVSSSS